MIPSPVPYTDGVTPGSASTFAGPVDALLIAFFVLSCLVVVSIIAMNVGFGLYYRRNREAYRRLPEHTTWLEITWVVIPLLVFLGFFVWSGALFKWMFDPPADAYQVGVVAKQWMWKFQHPDGRLEINVLHVPIGKPVRLVMTSEDVIHSLYVPAFRVKHDILPGRYEQMWFQATRIGAYHFFCTQYCGTFHAKMVGWIDVLSQRDFSRWLAAGKPSEPLAIKGRQLFSQFGCAGCHGAGSVVHAPRFEGLYGKPVTLQDGRRVIANDSYMRGCILHPYTQYVAGYPPIMPSFAGQLTESQIMAIVAYIRSLGSTSAEDESSP